MTGEKPHISHHPLVVLIVGATITSLLVPIVTHQISSKLARRTKAVEILKQANRTNRQLGMIETAIENFDHDVLTYPYSPEEFKTEQKELRKQIHTLYADFDTSAWSAFDDLSAESSILRIIPDASVRKFNELIGAYNTNLVATTKKLSVPWYEYVRAKESPDDWPHVDWKTYKSEMLALNKDRAAIVEKMARLFKGQ